MNKLIILTIIWGVVVYCESRNCLKTYNNKDLKTFYKKGIKVTCSNNTKQFTDASRKLLKYIKNIDNENFKLNRKVRVNIIFVCICT